MTVSALLVPILGGYECFGAVFAPSLIVPEAIRAHPVMVLCREEDLLAALTYLQPFLAVGTYTLC